MNTMRSDYQSGQSYETAISPEFDMDATVQERFHEFPVFFVPPLQYSPSSFAGADKWLFQLRAVFTLDECGDDFRKTQ
jgi:hypothetical protein